MKPMPGNLRLRGYNRGLVFRNRPAIIQMRNIYSLIRPYLVSFNLAPLARRALKKIIDPSKYKYIFQCDMKKAFQLVRHISLPN